MPGGLTRVKGTMPSEASTLEGRAGSALGTEAGSQSQMETEPLGENLITKREQPGRSLSLPRAALQA